MKELLVLIMFLICLAVQGQEKKEVFLQSKMNGSKTLSDGTTVEFWGYGIENQTTGNAKIELPGPTLRFNLGDTAVIQLNNDSPEDHTIHWHGLDVDQENDGVGHTSSDVHAGDTFMYEFVCTHPGTYLYHCHVLTPLHQAMGMYGVFIINGKDENHLYEENETKFTKEYSFLFSEMNTNWNINPLSPGPFALYEADYVMINGFSGQQLESEENVVKANEDDTLALRLSNMGYGSAEVLFPEELDVYIVGTDGRRIPKKSIDNVTLFPGERFDLIIRPNSSFDGEIPVNYYDLRNYNLIGVNEIQINISPGLGINTPSHKNTFKAYPVPFNKSLTVEVNDYPITLNLYDLTGRSIYADELVKNKTQLNNLPFMLKGIYILKVGDERTLIQKK